MVVIEVGPKGERIGHARFNYQPRREMSKTDLLATESDEPCPLGSDKTSTSSSELEEASFLL